MAKAKSDATFMSDFRKFFGRGLAILLPSIITLWILWQLTVFVYRNVGAPINAGLRLVILEVIPLAVGEEAPADEAVKKAEKEASPKKGVGLPEWWTPTRERVANYQESRRRDNLPEVTEQRAVVVLRRKAFEQWWKSRWYLEATGLVVAIILIYLSGLLLGNFLGKQIYGRLEKVLARVPVWKHIYPHVKQLVNMIMGEKQVAFSKAVLVQYPRQGIWTVGLVTNSTNPVLKGANGKDCYSVFIPSTPTPFTGFTIVVPMDEAVTLPVTIDQAVRFVITAGVLGFESRERPPGAVPAIDAMHGALLDAQSTGLPAKADPEPGDRPKPPEKPAE